LRNGVYYPYSLSPLVKVDENYQMCNLSIINMAIVKDIIMLMRPVFMVRRHLHVLSYP